MQQGWLVRAYGIPEATSVVLLHGFMQDATVWDNTAETLASSHYVLSPTMVPFAEGESGLSDLAEGVHGVVQQAVLQTHCAQVVLVGYSLGGRVAVEYARQHPEMLAGLVLEGASLGPKSEDDRVALEKRNLAWANRFQDARSIEEVVDFWEGVELFSSQRSLPNSVLPGQRRARLRSDKDHLVWLLREAGAHSMPLADETRAMLQGLDVPVLYEAGMQDQKSMEEARLIDDLASERMQTARFACGHNIHLESPIAYAERLAEFMSLID